jgi:hypothetical protein
VRNDSAPPAEDQATIEHLTFNLKTSLVRNDKMEGRDYLVVPMVMMVEGVHVGSNGPLLYPADELKKTPEVWNMKPVVVYHPEINGQGVTACDPDVATKQKIGVIMNTRWDARAKRLKAEAWLEEHRVREVDDRIANAIEENQVLELSTGLFTDNETKTGEHNGEAYVAIARNYRPDHLAVLPDRIGACSVADGAGFIRNELIGHNVPREQIDKVRALVLNTVETLGLRELVVNELSHGAVRDQLFDALIKRFPGKKTELGNAPGPWVESVFDGFVIFEREGKLYRLPYTIEDDTVLLADKEPTMVNRVVEYRTVAGAVIGNNLTTNSPKLSNNEANTQMKEKLVNDLIANHGWEETDRAFLLSLNEDGLSKLSKFKKDVPVASPHGASPPVANKQMTPEEFIAQAPEGMRDMLQSGLISFNEQRASLIASIKTNELNEFSDDELGAKSLRELKVLAKLATKPAVHNYAGLAPVAGAPAKSVETCLPLPKWE